MDLTARFKTRHPDVIRPFCSALGGRETIGPRLERGLGYVATGSADAASAFLRGSSWGPYLWITERAVTGTESGEVLRVTTLSGSGATVDPKRLGDLRAAAAAFLAREGNGLVVVDCLAYLVLHNGPERVARGLADLHDEVILGGGSLVVFVDASTANPRLVAWLAREFDPLPSLAAPSYATHDGLMA